MYERYYGLRHRPFALTPNTDCLYWSRVHREALDHVRLGLESDAGFVALTGEVGAGKTTVLQALVRWLDPRVTVARLVSTQLEPRELLEAILIDLDVEPISASKPAMLRDLARALVQHYRDGRQVLVVIDEAQNLPHETLEELRMISNLETETSKLLQILLAGQPQLRDRLALPDLEQLNQRITMRYHLMPLDPDDTHQYINHRLRVAAEGEPMVFRRDLTGTVHDRSGGLPRLINIICDAVLMAGYGDEQPAITAPLLAAVIRELETSGPLGSRTPGRRPWATSAVHWERPSALGG